MDIMQKLFTKNGYDEDINTKITLCVGLVVMICIVIFSLIFRIILHCRKIQIDCIGIKIIPKYTGYSLIILMSYAAVTAPFMELISMKRIVTIFCLLVILDVIIVWIIVIRAYVKERYKLSYLISLVVIREIIGVGIAISIIIVVVLTVIEFCVLLIEAFFCEGMEMSREEALIYVYLNWFDEKSK